MLVFSTQVCAWTVETVYEWVVGWIENGMNIIRAGCRVGDFGQKDNSAEGGIGETNRQKTRGIPFRTIPRKRKIFGIPYPRTKIDANSRNSVLNYSAEEKTIRNSPIRGTKKQAFL